VVSASEKVEALMTGYMDRVEAVGASYADAWLIATFHTALPQIVAVVEAAESYAADLGSVEAGEVPAECEDLDAALAALEEALS
jgi:hypothetical protein